MQSRKEVSEIVERSFAAASSLAAAAALCRHTARFLERNIIVSRQQVIHRNLQPCGKLYQGLSTRYPSPLLIHPQSAGADVKQLCQLRLGVAFSLLKCAILSPSMVKTPFLIPEYHAKRCEKPKILSNHFSTRSMYKCRKMTLIDTKRKPRCISSAAKHLSGCRIFQ